MQRVSGRSAVICYVPAAESIHPEDSGTGRKYFNGSSTTVTNPCLSFTAES
jgi:hypothetical protein